jgi:hypothetical protein
MKQLKLISDRGNVIHYSEQISRLLTSVRIMLGFDLPEVMLFVGRQVFGLRGFTFKVFFSFTKLTTHLKLG